MHVAISQLVKEFENGRMTRRGLVQSLAILAVGGQAMRPEGLSAVEVTPDSPGGAFKTVGLDHISYAVSDYGRSRDFYVDLMGWEVQDDDGERQASLRIGDVGDIIIRNSRQPMSQAREGRPPLTGVVNHISWRTEAFNTDEVREELERRGLNPRRDQGGGDGYDSYHVLDPDGWDLQIS